MFVGVKTRSTHAQSRSLEVNKETHTENQRDTKNNKMATDTGVGVVSVQHRSINLVTKLTHCVRCKATQTDRRRIMDAAAKYVCEVLRTDL